MSVTRGCPSVAVLAAAKDGAGTPAPASWSPVVGGLLLGGGDSPAVVCRHERPGLGEQRWSEVCSMERSVGVPRTEVQGALLCTRALRLAHLRGLWTWACPSAPWYTGDEGRPIESARVWDTRRFVAGFEFERRGEARGPGVGPGLCSPPPCLPPALSAPRLPAPPRRPRSRLGAEGPTF